MLLKVLLFLISVLCLATTLAILQVKEVDKEGKKKDVTLTIERKFTMLFTVKL